MTKTMCFPLTYILKLPIFGCPLSNNEPGDPLFLLRIFAPHACLLLVKKSYQEYFNWIFLAQAALNRARPCCTNEYKTYIDLGGIHGPPVCSELSV